MEIPDDICFDILTRLLVKSLLRFKCVSKAWSLLISSPSFVDAHFSRSSSRPSLLTSFYGLTEGSRYFSSPLYHHPKRTLVAAIPIELMSGCRFSSLNGLMLCDDAESVLIVYNPSKRQSIPIGHPVKHPNPGTFFDGSYLLYDPIGKVHKVLRRTVYLFHQENWVFTLGQPNSWRRIEDSPFHEKFRYDPPICIDGFLYYIVSNKITLIRDSLVAFDVRHEKFQLFYEELHLHPILKGRNAKLIDCGGHLGAVDYYSEPGCMDLWVLEDRARKTYSTRRIVLPPGYWKDLFVRRPVFVAGSINSGEIIWVEPPLGYGSFSISVFYHDVKSNSVRRVEMQGTTVPRDHRLGKFTLYTESLY